MVSEQFRQLAQPLFLSHISICAFSRNVRKQCAQLKALSDGKSHAVYLARTLTIDFRSSFDEGKSVTTLKNALTKNLERAIRSLKNVNKVMFVLCFFTKCFAQMTETQQMENWAGRSILGFRTHLEWIVNYSIAGYQHRHLTTRSTFPPTQRSLKPATNLFRVEEAILRPTY